jgi:hypothetical protein
MSGLTAEQERVIALAACPECEAPIGQRCTRGADDGGVLAGLTGPYANHQEWVWAADGRSPAEIARMSAERSRRPRKPGAAR